MPLPSSVQSIALRFTKGNPPTQLSHTQTIPLESIQVGTNASNSVKVDSTFVAAFNAEQEGTIFTPSIVINYGNNITTTTSPASGVPNFVPRPPPLPLTLAYFNFDSNGNDASTNNNHLTNSNSVTFNTFDFKRGTGAASFNGSNYFEIANDDGRFSPDNFTIAFWVKPKSTSVTHQSIASCRNMTNVNTGWMIYIVYGSYLNFVVGNGSNSLNGLACDIGTFINNWVHVAITLNKSSRATLIYINGTLFSTNTLVYANNTGTNMRIGAGGNESSAGLFLVNDTLLDDFKFYNSVLSASEISSIYAE